MRLADKVALVTGGGSGIGRASAEAFVREGAAVLVADWRPEAAEATAQAIRQNGGRAAAAVGDVAVAGDVERMTRAALEAFGRIDVLMNSAGQELVANVLETSEEAWDRVLGTNLKAIYLVSRAVLPHMLAQGSGSIVNVASQLALVGAKNFAAYTASKGGVISLTRSMALDHAQAGVRVNALCPGAIDTPLLRRQFEKGSGPQGTLEDLARLHPVGRLGRPEEIAQAAVFLASDDSSFMTGATLVVDGGYTAW